MADPSSSPDTGEATGTGPSHTSTTVYPGTPRWVKVFGIITLVLVLLVGGIMIASGGQHGPGRHMPAGAPSGHTPPAAPGVQPARQPGRSEQP